MAITGWAVYKAWPGTTETADVDQLDQVDGRAPSIQLSTTKLAAAGIKAEPATRQSLTVTRTLPGRFRYDDRLHVALRAPTDGVVESVSMKPGDTVRSGQTIAVLRSPSVGTARGAVRAAQAVSELASSQRDWQVALYKSVQELAESVRENESVDAIEKKYDNATLGSYRSQILTAYSKALLASRTFASVSDIKSGAVSGRVIQSRQSEQQQTQVELESVIEQALFETKQNCKRAESDAEAAKRKLFVAQQTLGTLLGSNATGDIMPDISPNDTDLARLEIRSPISGTIERKVYSATERVTAGSEMFVVADTSRLWVEGDIRGRDWDLIKAKEGDTVYVTTPTADDERVEAKVYYMGREVDAASGAIPLVAEVANVDYRYRPGLFARMEVPIDELTDVLAIPERAVVDVDGDPTVFVADGAGFRPVVVQTGFRSGPKVEIRSGISEGQLVVVQGAFVLKSELLLEGEE